MRARARKPKTSEWNMPLPAQATSILRKAVFSSSQTQQRPEEQDSSGNAGAISGFNFGNIPVLPPANSVAQRTCDTCSDEYSSAAHENRAVKQDNLCPKCRLDNNHLPSQSGQDAGVGDFGSGQAQSTFDQGQSAKPAAPSKALGETEESREAKPRPYAGSATIQCNGSGGYEIVYNSWASAKCGTKACVTAHESSHIADWKAKWPSGCTGRAKGYLPKGDPPHDKPLMTVAEYKAFLKKSECKAHTVDLKCAKALPKKGACKKTVNDYIKLTEKQLKKWCPSKALVGAVIGAIIGGVAGGVIGGPVGAVVGGLAGAAIGGIAGALF